MRRLVIKKYEVLILIALVEALIIILLLCNPAFAGEWKHCEVNFKTWAGLCEQNEKILNVKEPVYFWSHSGLVAENIIIRDSVWVSVDTVYRQFRGLAVIREPQEDMTGFTNSSTGESYWFPQEPGRAILIWEEIEK